MSTRCITHIYEGEEIIASIYRHSDGYPEGHGKELAAFLKPLRIVNGLSTYQNVANGMGCLAAQMVAHFKDGPGQIYLYKAGTEPDDIEFVYRVRCKGAPYDLPREGIAPTWTVEDMDDKIL